MQRIGVLMAADEQYATPLIVTVTSLLEHLRPGVGLDLYVMDAGLAPATRVKLEGAWSERLRLHWAPFDDSKLAPLRGYGYPSSTAANARLLAGSSLPDDVKKIIYLDADLLIQRDIAELGEIGMCGNIALAIQDSFIARYGERPYFNSGVMVIDLEAWRASGMEARCLEAARRLPKRTKWLDQHVLNECLAGRWRLLPPVWNKQFFLDVYPDWRCTPYGEEEFREARSGPAIVHFCSSTKPWHWFCDHPPEDVLAYRDALGRTGAGLTGGPSLARRALEFFAAPHRRLLNAAAAAVRAKRRKYALRKMLPDIVKLAILHPWTLVTVPVSVVYDRARW